MSPTSSLEAVAEAVRRLSIAACSFLQSLSATAAALSGLWAETKRFTEDMLEPVASQANLLLKDENFSSVIRQYENRRVIHLAYHHRKERVRKKNLHRLNKSSKEYI